MDSLRVLLLLLLLRALICIVVSRLCPELGGGKIEIRRSNKFKLQMQIGYEYEDLFSGGYNF